MEYRQLNVRVRPEVFEALTMWTIKTRISKAVGVEMAVRKLCEDGGITVKGDAAQEQVK